LTDLNLFSEYSKQADTVQMHQQLVWGGSTS
jgi:hypothetical protein